MDDQVFLIALSVALILWGVSTFLPERVLVVIAGVSAIVAGVIGLVLAL